MTEPLYDYGDMVEGEKSQSVNLRIEMPKPYAPKLDDLLPVLALVREEIEQGGVDESRGIVPVDGENAGKLSRLYDFGSIVPTVWEGMAIWASELLPEGTIYIGYEERFYLVYRLKLYHAAVVKKQTWTLNAEQRGAVLNHVEVTLEAIKERGEQGIPVGFIKQLHSIKEALG